MTKTPNPNRPGETEDAVYLCNCLTHAISVSAFVWKDPTDPEIFLTFWSRGHGRSRPWRCRLEDIWHILRRGYAPEDEIMLHIDEARSLGEKLIEFCDQWVDVKVNQI